MAAVVDSIGDGILLLGRDRHVAYANPAAALMLNCDSAAELIGMSAQVFSRRFRVSYPTGALVPPEQFASQRVFDAAVHAARVRLFYRLLNWNRLRAPG